MYPRLAALRATVLALCTCAGLLVVCPPCAAAPAVQVELTGLPRSHLGPVLASLSITRYVGEKRPTEARVRRLHARAPQEIRAALTALGYPDPTVSGALEATGQGWRARYAVQRGEPIKLSQVDVLLSGAGATQPELLTAVRNFPLSVGERAVQSRYEDGKAALARSAAEHGYFDARFTRQRLELDLEQNQARVVLHLDTGERYRFAGVSFADTVVRQKLLARYVRFQPGAPYSYAEVLGLQTALSGSGYFGEVDVRPQPNRADRTVPLTVTLSARKRSQYGAGVGFATDVGPRLTGDYERRYVNKRGHRLTSRLELSPVRSQLQTEYAIPVGDPRQDRVLLGARLAREDTETARSDSLKLSVGRQGMRQGWQEKVSLELLRERFDTGEDEGDATLLMPTVGYSRVFAQDPVRPYRGGRVSAQLRGAAAPLLSDTSLVQGLLSGKYIQPLTQRQRILTRAELGATWVQAFGTLPASLRFYAGGDQSVRGYEYNTLGPRDSDQVIGGRNVVSGSVEYEYTVRKPFSLATFFDAGNAFDGPLPPLRQAAGVGVRWLSPVGPVRVDVAQPLNDPGMGPRLHFSLGPEL